jgi:zeaxanthin glucosyltransferase
MAHLGVICLPMSSHMNLFPTLTRKLASRGHCITFFGISDNETKARAAGFEFETIESDTLPPGTLGHMMHEMSRSNHFGALRLQGRFDQLLYRAILTKGHALVQRSSLDGLIVDQAEACGGSVAEAKGFPWVSVCNGLCLNSERDVPPFLTSWPYSDKWYCMARNRAAYFFLKVATHPTQKLINQYREQWKLAPLSSFNDSFSPFAQICQQPREFDFPRRELPDSFHYVGPIRAPSSTPVAFPWDRLDDRPLIYASLGTLVNRHKQLYLRIAEACSGLNAQLVISLGGGDKTSSYSGLPGSPIVVEFAPQVALLARTTLTITHAGLNTTLESLSQGVPIVAIPITFEQPAIAARIRWTGTGEFVFPARATTGRLRAIIRQVIETPAYQQAAVRMKTIFSTTRGCTAAADIIEQVIRTGKPVTSLALTANTPGLEQLNTD